MKIPTILTLGLLLAVGNYAQSGRRGGLPIPQPQTTPALRPTPTPKLPQDDIAPDDGEVVRVETDLVTVPVRVIDRKGHFVDGLAKENFKIFEDGVEQEVSYFATEKEPFTVALVLDMSYSTTFRISDIQAAAIAFINQLGTDDKVLVVSFDQDVHMLCEATNDRQQIYRAIMSTKIQTGTSLYEALDIVMNDRLKRVKGRKAIILFTDGVDTTSTRSNDLQNINDIRELDALVYPIRYDTFADVQDMKDGAKTVVLNPSTLPFPGQKPGGNPVPTVGVPDSRGTTADDYRRAREYLDQMALRSGGRLYEASTSGNLASAFSRIASELREYYSLGFYPKTDGKVGRIRKLKVKVNREDVAVNARDSYIVGAKRKKKF
ncbi:MAG: VWA domain-containing protein [Acidobacteriota bacterium]